MDFSTNHDRDGSNKAFAFRITEEFGDGVNTAEIGVRIEDYIDSRSELSLAIRKNALEFLKRAVSQLESELEV